MCRWGECTVFNEFTVLSELLHYIRCVLTVRILPSELALRTDEFSGSGVSARHEGSASGKTAFSIICSSLITLQDISLSNIMHRWFDPREQGAELPIAERQLGGTLYCLMDYDLSLLHEEAQDLTCYFRPIEESWIGSAWYHPSDYKQGEWQYNPFAFDVACLGRMIMSTYAVRGAILTQPSLYLTQKPPRIRFLRSLCWRPCSTR